MATKECKNHWGRKAVGHCATCHIPLCEECAMRSPATGDQIFCSEAHLQRFVQMMEYGAGRGGKRPNRSLSFRNLFNWAIAIAVIALILHVLGVVNLGIPLHNIF